MQSINMLYAFLENRKMRVRIENTFSTAMPINGGSPQGTLLGNLIFIIATADLDKNINHNQIQEEIVEDEDEEEESNRSFDSNAPLIYNTKRNIFPDSDTDEENDLTNAFFAEHELLRTTFQPEERMGLL